ncbi:hypothetical protein [Micromonospora sp. NBC_01796]|uniref:hypothetical protein n=1 Tax=Micromonospora sp. NBC_01796 TaxID=2975987 RepID=UPI002DDBC38C|nr:hypothetical protein [Micromonospora sp. NBC_01796]WSA83386.1 hypothetical protein OIE47_23625 [Micromonospora sp. NBC_01796]
MDDDEDDLRAPHRPGADWRCRDDNGEWPCPVFRRRMWTLYRDDPDRMLAFMAHFRDRAAPVLVELTAEQIEVRFLGWIDEPPIRRRLRAV